MTARSSGARRPHTAGARLLASRSSIPLNSDEVLALRNSLESKNRVLRLKQVREAERAIAKEKRDVYQRLRRESRVRAVESARVDFERSVKASASAASEKLKMGLLGIGAGHVAADLKTSKKEKSALLSEAMKRDQEGVARDRLVNIIGWCCCCCCCFACVLHCTAAADKFSSSRDVPSNNEGPFLR